MKRLFALSSLLVAATLTVTGLAVAQNAIVQASTQQVTSKVTPKRDRKRPYKFRTTGKVVPPPTCAVGDKGTPGGNCVPRTCPAGNTNPIYCQPVPTAALCTGKVSVTFRRGAITVGKRTVGLLPSCTYSSRITLGIGSRGRLKVSTRFLGNVYLLAKSASIKSARAG